MMTLIVNDFPIDLSEEVIEFKEAPNALQTLDAKVGAYTNTFTIYRTANNQRAFDFIGTALNASRAPYTRLPAEIEFQGNKIYAGFVKIEKVTSNEYTAVFFGSNSNWIQKIKDKSIRDLDLSEFDHIWNRTSIVNSQTHQWSKAYIYAMFDSGSWGLIDSPDRELATPFLFPSVFVKKIFEKIFEEAGLSVAGNWFNNDQRLAKQLVAFNLQDPRGIQHPAFDTRAKFSKDINGVTSFVQNIPDTEGFGPFTRTGELTVPFDISEQFWNQGLFSKNIEFRAELSFFLKMNIRGIGSGASFSYPQTPELRIYKGSVIFRKYQFTIVGDIAFFDLEQIIEAVDLSEDLEFRVFYSVFKDDLQNENGARIEYTSSSMEQQLFARVNYNGRNKIFPNSTWRVAQNLPDISQSDFIKEIANQYLLIIYEKNGTINPVPFEELGSRLNQSVDWSNKVAQSPENEISYRFFDLAQNNSLQYLQNENEQIDREFINVNDEWLEFKTVLYESVFASTLQITLPVTQTNNRRTERLAYIPTLVRKDGVVLKPYRESTSYVAGEFVFHSDGFYKCTANHNTGAESDPNINFFQFLVDNGDWADNQDVNPRVLSLDFPVSDPNYYAFINDDITIIQNLRYGVFSQVINSGIRQDWSALVSDYYPLYISTVQKLEVALILVAFDSIDFAKLDFTQPVYIENVAMGLQGFYYINQLKSYQPNNSKLAQFELIKINQ